jgi:hypothetical protein
MVSQTPTSLEKSPWKDNQENVEYDDQAIETFEGGKGADDENEWQEEDASGSKATATVTGDPSPSIQTVLSETSSKQTPTSQPLPWSPDPRDEANSTQQPVESPVSPPKLSRVTPAKPLTGLARIAASRDDMLRCAHIAQQHQKERDAKNTVTPTTASPNNTESVTLGANTPEPNPAPEPDPDTSEWNTIQKDSSASKRKAKSSPNKSTASSIRKPAVSRSLRKKLFEQPATPYQEAPAPEN